MKKDEWKALYEELNAKLRLQRAPVSVKYLKSADEIEIYGRVRVQKAHFAPCMIINQASQFGWTVCGLGENIHMDYCRGIHGMYERNEKWASGAAFVGGWFMEAEQAHKHNTSLTCLDPEYAAVLASPIGTGRIEDPDVCIIFATPSQAFMLLGAYQMDDYKRLSFTFSGESTCSDSWVTTMKTGEPKLSLPCFADIKFAGMKEEHVIVSMTPADLKKSVECLGKLHKNGLRYPIVGNGTTTDMWAPGGLPDSYQGY